MKPIAPLGVVALWAAAGCTTTPAVTRLPPGDLPLPQRMVDAAGAPSAELEVEPLAMRGVRGGRIAFTLDGTPEQVVAALLDFENAAGHRSWADRFEVLSRDGDRVVARWYFHGRFGIRPTVTVAFAVREPEPGVFAVRYRLEETAFGLGAYFGDYWVYPSSGGRSLLVERVYIDSGVTFANASALDVANGLRADAEHLRAWLRRRAADPR